MAFLKSQITSDMGRTTTTTISALHFSIQLMRADMRLESVLPSRSTVSGMQTDAVQMRLI